MSLHTSQSYTYTKNKMNSLWAASYLAISDAVFLMMFLQMFSLENLLLFELCEVLAVCDVFNDELPWALSNTNHTVVAWLI